MRKMKDIIDEIAAKINVLELQIDEKNREYEKMLANPPKFSWWKGIMCNAEANWYEKIWHEYYNQIQPLNDEINFLYDQWENVVYDFIYIQFGNKFMNDIYTTNNS